MRSSLRDPRTRHLAVAAAIVIVGLASAAVIFIRASGGTPEGLLELSADTSKKYLRDLEMYGGTANVLAVEFSAWFGSLWHGRRLAYTVATLSLVGALAYVFFTLILPPYEVSEGPGVREDGTDRDVRPPAAPTGRA